MVKKPNTRSTDNDNIKDQTNNKSTKNIDEARQITTDSSNDSKLYTSHLSLTRLMSIIFAAASISTVLTILLFIFLPSLQTLLKSNTQKYISQISAISIANQQSIREIKQDQSLFETKNIIIEKKLNKLINQVDKIDQRITNFKDHIELSDEYKKQLEWISTTLKSQDQAISKYRLQLNGLKDEMINSISKKYSKLQSKVQKLNQDLNILQQKLENKYEWGKIPAKKIITVLYLQNKIKSGKPFQKELAAFQELSGDVSPELKYYAKDGLITGEKLSNKLINILKKTSTYKKSNENVVNKLLKKFNSLVKIEKGGESFKSPEQHFNENPDFSYNIDNILININLVKADKDNIKKILQALKIDNFKSALNYWQLLEPKLQLKLTNWYNSLSSRQNLQQEINSLK